MTVTPALRGPASSGPIALLFLLLLLCLPAAAEDGDAWVRIHHAADTAALQSIQLDGQLEDYGSFLWGRMSRQEAERLKQRGLSLTVSRNPFELTLGGERFDPAAIENQRNIEAANPDGGFHLVQFQGPIRSRWLADLRATGIEVAQPLHPFSYYVWATRSQMNALRSLDSVRATLPLQPDWKVQPHLREFDGEIRPTMALASAHVDERTLQDQLEQFGTVHRITPLSRHFRVVHMDLAGDLYGRLSELGAIYTVQYIQQDAGPRSEMANQSIVGGIDGETIQPGYLDWLNDIGLDGAGVTVGIVDGGVQESHPDLTDNMVPCTGTEGSCTGASDSHGTHVAGAVGGTGASGTTDSNGFLRGQGVAPGASLVNQAYSPFTGAGSGGMVPEGMLSIYKDSAESGALLTNNSWGPTGSPQGYDIPTMEIDYISRDALPEEPGAQPVLAVWSVMNGNGDSGGSCSPSSLGSPDEAKNLFAVGSTGLQSGSGAQVAIDEVFSVSSNSGHGPACDGRRRPDIVAPGCSTDSTDTGSSYSLKCGTSMASPVVSGAIALWAEGYIAQTGNNPSPALMKASFIATARDLEGGTNADGGIMGHRPDRFQGYGRLDLDATMNPAGDEVYLMDQEQIFTETGQEWGMALNAADPSQPMQVVLAWTDAPGHGQGGTTPAWVNDLDLQVNALDGNTYLGNVVGNDGWSDSGGSPDGMNNTEAVWLRPDQHQGGIDLSVLATDIAGDALNPWNPADPSQDFAIACYNCIVGDPTFSVSATPDSLEACVPETGSNDYDIAVDVSAIGAYTGTVDLATTGEPAGISSVVDPDSVSVPDSSVWTVTVDESASAGSLLLRVEGDDGSDIHDAEVSVTLDDYLNDAPPLVEPADGASDTSLTPVFGWDGLTDIEEYRIQIATDAGFGDIVVDETVAETTGFMPAAELALGTEYFWRVQGSNLCGGGEWSETRSFSTRLEPEADISATAMSFSVPQGYGDEQTIQLGNAGTGNLTFEISSDEPEAGPLMRDQHDPARDEVLELADFALPGGGSASETVEAGIATSGQVVGFTFEGTVSNLGSGAWASDMSLTLTAPDDNAYSVGGYQTSYPDWEFQGSGSGSAGTYSSTHIGTDIFGAEGAADEGDWQFDFVDEWTGGMDWADVTITLHKTAPPYCGDEPVSADWLSVSPTSGSIAEGEADELTIAVDTASLAEGEYTAWLCLATNDPNAEMIPVEVNLTVTEFVEDEVHEDRFEQTAR
ncbi:S8 family serine peptidase [Wenzhouxiangella sp. EGI_FJ10409]|uniref:S8 family serine peptidase n=1 Tax=Wenzhouxiangella sp. EGI_FJ10409 TaxID=3243767 RepID=UPI0035E2EEF0